LARQRGKGIERRKGRPGEADRSGFIPRFEKVSKGTTLFQKSERNEDVHRGKPGVGKVRCGWVMRQGAPAMLIIAHMFYFVKMLFYDGVDYFMG
jgi:hypothetical protein